MGWPSILEDIQKRRDEAQHFCRSPFAAVSTGQYAPAPPVKAAEVAPEPHEDPDARHRIIRNWRRRRRLSRGDFESTHDTVVMRGGEQRWTGRIRDVFIRAFDRGGPNRALQIDFKMPSKGGGDTHVSGRFGPQDFQMLIQAMLVADPQAALQAMTDELAHHRD
ncbi:MAG TPA: hypothetical protein VFA53_09655 [Xanthobacteraceae bacterium]|nr:hypothetical protein [Xanthobacteraceae bacterium]